MSADKQAVEFFIKRAENVANQAVQHCRDKEYDKGANLFRQAYIFYKKAENAMPEDEKIKTRLEEIKGKYQDAKQKMDE